MLDMRLNRWENNLCTHSLCIHIKKEFQLDSKKKMNYSCEYHTISIKVTSYGAQGPTFGTKTEEIKTSHYLPIAKSLLL